ncbi:MAG: PD-(D/E)XK nuclease family protein [Chlamydiia bacterium]|nr:PD-(D/E)XK nuclease family protein [Chlamydiia bacterium]
MNKISGVSERDIDLLLLEEFITSEVFQDLFIHNSKFKDMELSFVEARKSVTDTIGESDLEVSFINDDDETVLLMIENKINANFQKNQLERYRKRGENYKKKEKISDFTTILVAPELYHSGENKEFDVRVNYETLITYFHNNKDLGRRSIYKILLLESAIRKTVSGYDPEMDDVVTQFWKDYWRLANKEAKELYMSEPGHKPSASSFVYFRNIKLPKNVDLVHKMVHGYFDLQFSGMGNKMDVFMNKYSEKLEQNMKIVKAGKSAAIRVEVPKLSFSDSFESQKDKVLLCFLEEKKLLTWFEKVNK